LQNLYVQALLAKYAWPKFDGAKKDLKEVYERVKM